MPDDAHSSRLISFARRMGLNRLAEQWQKQYAETDTAVHVLVIGEYNHGKSSLINALIGRVVLPYGVTPTTKLDTTIRFGADATEVRLFSGGSLIETWTWEDYEENHLTLGAFENIPDGADHIEIAIQETPFESACVFVDTPGLNEASMTRENYLDRYLNRADVLMFVLDASQAMTRAEQGIVKALADKNQDISKILVINKCDRLDEEEWLDVCAHVESAVAPILGNELFYMVSSRKKDIGDMADLRDRLKKEISERKNDVASRAESRIAREMAGILKFFCIIARYINDLPNSVRAQLAKDFGEIDRPLTPHQCDLQLETVVTMMDMLKIQVHDEIDKFKSEFLMAMPREIDKATIADVEAYFEDFIDARFDEMSERLKGRCRESLTQLLARVWHIAYSDVSSNGMAAIDWTRMVFPFEIVDHYVRQPGKTGAFGDTQISVFDNHISLLDIGVTGLITGKMARAHREKFKDMARNSIERRAVQTTRVFDTDLEAWRESILLALRECSPRFVQMIREILVSKTDLSVVVSEVELEVAEMAGGLNLE